MASLCNKSRHTIIARQVAIADTALTRIVGLLGRPSLAPDEALIITHCRSIHMFFMRFAIDVIFTDRNGIVVGLVRNIPPFRISPYFIKAFQAIELFPGTIEKSETQAGDKVGFED